MDIFYPLRVNSNMKLRDCLALIDAEYPAVTIETRLRAFQAIINADKLHLLTDRQRREVSKHIKWGELSPKGFIRLPIDEDPQTGY